jgi:hypothetical protein
MQLVKYVNRQATNYRKVDGSRTMNAVQKIPAGKQLDRETKNKGIPGQCGKRKALVKGPANRNRYTYRAADVSGT